jgi:hypothetical protein
MSERLSDLPRYVRQRGGGWQGADHQNGPWRPIPAPQSGLPWRTEGPAVPDGREPASVALQPSDEEIMGLMPQQMHDDLAAAVRAMAEQEGIDSTPAKGVLRIILNRHVVDLARAVLARWGRLAAAPVPLSERLPGSQTWPCT